MNDERQEILKKMVSDYCEFMISTSRHARRKAIFFNICQWTVIILTFLACWFCLFVLPGILQVTMGL